MTGLYVDLYGTFIETFDPASLYMEKSKLNGTRSSSFFFMTQACYDPTADHSNMNFIFGDNIALKISLDSNEMVNYGRNVQATKLGGYLALAGPMNFTFSNNFFLIFFVDPVISPRSLAL